MKSYSTLALTTLVAALASAGPATAERPPVSLLSGVFAEEETGIVRSVASPARFAESGQLEDGFYTTALGGDASGDLFRDDPIELVRNGGRKGRSGRAGRNGSWNSFTDGLTDGNAEDSNWTIRLGAVWLQRSDPNNAILVTEDAAPGTTLLNANQFDLGFGTGVELDAIRRNVGDSGWDLQGVIFNVDSMQDSLATVPVTGAFVQYITPFGDTEDGEMTASYESSLLSLELNARRQIGPEWLTVLGGFRYMRLDEELLIGILYDSDPPYLNVHRISSTNDMFGFQLGGEADLFSNDRWSLSANGKAGWYANSSGNSVLITENDAPLFSSEDDTVSPAFVSEAGLAGAYRINDYLSLRAKYQVMWVNDVALASAQVASSDPLAGTADVALDDVFYQSVFFGLEYLY